MEHSNDVNKYKYTEVQKISLFSDLLTIYTIVYTKCKPPDSQSDCTMHCGYVYLSDVFVTCTVKMCPNRFFFKNHHFGTIILRNSYVKVISDYFHF